MPHSGNSSDDRGRGSKKAVQDNTGPCIEYSASMGHRIHVQQLLLNLIVNGMEAMEAIDTKNRRLPIKTLGTDRAIEIRIIDTGVGFGRS
jgi:C4-dicarboxylate-specific signal transduction histidine kinase